VIAGIIQKPHPTRMGLFAACDGMAAREPSVGVTRMGMYSACIGAGKREGPGLKSPDNLCATYRRLKPAATPKNHDLAVLICTLISDALH
jgi:hypothetical protein